MRLGLGNLSLDRGGRLKATRLLMGYCASLSRSCDRGDCGEVPAIEQTHNREIKEQRAQPGRKRLLSIIPVHLLGSSSFTALSSSLSPRGGWRSNEVVITRYLAFSLVCQAAKNQLVFAGLQ